MTTASLGVALASDDTPLSETIREADRALLDAKRAGRNRVHIAATSRPPLPVQSPQREQARTSGRADRPSDDDRQGDPPPSTGAATDPAPEPGHPPR